MTDRNPQPSYHSKASLDGGTAPLAGFVVQQSEPAEKVVRVY